MLKKIIIGLLVFAGSAYAHKNGCVVCSGHQYEFQGSHIETMQRREAFWRAEEMVCEKHWTNTWRELKEKTSPRLDQEFTSESERSNEDKLQKVTVLSKIKQRISNRR